MATSAGLNRIPYNLVSPALPSLSMFLSANYQTAHCAQLTAS